MPEYLICTCFRCELFIGLMKFLCSFIIRISVLSIRWLHIILMVRYYLNCFENKVLIVSLCTSSYVHIYIASFRIGVIKSFLSLCQYWFVYGVYGVHSYFALSKSVCIGVCACTNMTIGCWNGALFFKCFGFCSH